MSGRFTRGNKEAGYRHYREMAESVASTGQSPAASAAPSDMDNVIEATWMTTGRRRLRRWHRRSSSVKRASVKVRPLLSPAIKTW